MVNYMLYISGELENLTNFQPRGSVDDPDFTYYFKFKCENCGEVTEKETCVSLNGTLPLPKKGTTNLIQKCKFCKREGTVTMIPGRGSPLTNDSSELGKYALLMVFDCRGFEPLDFVPLMMSSQTRRSVRIASPNPDDIENSPVNAPANTSED
ncbi:UPF0587 protein C1orf123 homolog [Cynara cardunculus var. scolymus]|uniref:UPF0587 protein C1orf123 homolog n=1 Tax=Cynara cardunculus var. scolymus TaxID=59895 RepID=UPI000D62F776|nr:UPF0587 protein C1orf123 homolog [Cynara cardunculus var. scolymus]